MKNKKNIINLTVLVVVAVGSFYVGTVTAKNNTPTRGQFIGSGMMGENGQYSGMRGARGGGVTAGAVISKDATSITVKAQDGSTKIVLISPSTLVTKSATGTIDELVVDKEVVVTGKANTDGSITAQSVQLRATSTIPRQ